MVYLMDYEEEYIMDEFKGTKKYEKKETEIKNSGRDRNAEKKKKKKGENSTK